MQKKESTTIFNSRKQPTKVLQQRNAINFPARDPARDERIIINVRGYRFETYRATLDCYPDTFLGSAEKRNEFYDKQNKELRLNRDPEVFQCVLFFYQSRGILAKPEWTPEDVFRNELSFYLLKDRFRCSEKSDGDDSSLNLEVRKNHCLNSLWLLMEEPHSSHLAKVFAHVCLAIIVMSILTYCIETLPQFYDTEDQKTRINNQLIFFILETTFVVWFTMEYLARLVACPQRWKFLRSPMGIVDFLVIVPYFITVAVRSPTATTAVSLAFLRVIRLVRVLRILKLTRYSKGMKVLGRTLRESFGQLKSLFLCLAMAVILSSSSLYYFEGYGYQNSVFSSIPATFWFTIITMTTVGYGDMVPLTTFGKIATSLCLVSGIIILLCLPTPVFIAHFGRFYRICITRNMSDTDNVRTMESPSQEDIDSIDSVALIPIWAKHQSGQSRHRIDSPSAYLDTISKDQNKDCPSELAVTFSSTLSIFNEP